MKAFILAGVAFGVMTLTACSSGHSVPATEVVDEAAERAIAAAPAVTEVKFDDEGEALFPGTLTVAPPEGAEAVTEPAADEVAHEHNIRVEEAPAAESEVAQEASEQTTQKAEAPASAQ